MREGRINPDALDEIRRDMEQRAEEKVPTVELSEGMVMPGLAVLKALEEFEEPGELPGWLDDLREKFTHDVAHIGAAKMGRIPIYVDEEERFAPFSELEAPSPRNWEVFDMHMAWHEYMIGRHMDTVAQMQFALDVTEDLTALGTTEGKGDRS